MWTVTRQRQSNGELVVEISGGGIDYANPGCFPRKYQGELKEYSDPKDAVEAAIRIAQLWQNDSSQTIFIGAGNTGGNTIEFESMPLNDETFTLLRTNAAKCWEALPKCAECHKLLGEQRFGYDGVYDCCSERCAERHYPFAFDDEE